jgi:hypothetical protein
LRGWQVEEVKVSQERPRAQGKPLEQSPPWPSGVTQVLGHVAGAPQQRLEAQLSLELHVVVAAPFPATAPRQSGCGDVSARRSSSATHDAVSTWARQAPACPRS